jgi:RimJ/RimL family protein N-acetyltransferase
LKWAIEHTDAATLRSRFLGGTPHLTPELLTHLTTVDYVRRFALVAADMATGLGIAVARYERLDDDVAEVAVVVDRGWRRAGVATSLIEMLADAALDAGIHAFTAIYLAENRPVAALAELAGRAGEQMIRDGIAEFAVRLDRARVSEDARGGPGRGTRLS